MTDVTKFLLTILFIVVVAYVARACALEYYQKDYSPLAVFCREELKGELSYRANHTICVKPNGEIVELE